MDTKSKIKRYVRKNTSVVLSIPLLIVLNMMSNLVIQFPWAIVPIIGIFIALADDFVKIFLADDDSTHAVKAKATKSATSTYDPNITAQINQARRYRSQLEALLKSTTDPIKQARLKQLAEQMDEWLAVIEATAARLIAFKNDAAIQHDLVAVPESVRKLTTQLNTEQDPRVRGQVEKALATRASQLDALEKLQATTRHAEVQIESSVAALGTLYSKALSFQSASQMADYSHLAADVDEQVLQLGEQLQALEEIHLEGQSV